MSRREKAAAYHGVEGVKFAPLLSSGEYAPKAQMLDVLYAKSLSLTSQVEAQEQYADDRLLFKVPQDKGYDGELGTTAPDPELEKVAGFALEGSRGLLQVAQVNYARGALFYVYEERDRNGRVYKVKCWCLNVEVGKGSKTHNTDESAVNFGAYAYPLHVYGEDTLQSDGETRYVDDDGVCPTTYFITCWPNDPGYAAFGDSVPKPALADPAALSSLSLGTLTLSPAFDPAVTSYTAATTNATNTIKAEAADSAATVSISVGGTTVQSGSPATWTDGGNTVTITVTNGEETKIYTVTVTKA